jgi:hypothetical protein
MGAFGQVIPVIGTGNGFLGEVSRSGGGDPFIISRQSNVNNAANISFGDAVVLLPDSTGGTCKQFADWIANGGGLVVACTTNSNTTVTPTSLAGISAGMLVKGTGIPVGAYVTAVNPITGNITISQAATSSGTPNLSFVVFGGIAVREVVTELGYPYTPAATEVGYYAPGKMVGLLVRGSITIKVPVGTPVADGPAYLRTILNGSIPAGLVGSFEANSDTVNSLLLSNIPQVQAFFKTGTLDANDLCELTLLSRVAA